MKKMASSEKEIDLSDDLILKKIENDIKSGKIQIDWNGHFSTGANKTLSEHLKRYLFSNLGLSLLMMIEPDKSNLIRAYSSKKPMHQRVPLIGLYIECGECAERITISTNGVSWKNDKPCPYPLGLGPTIFELNVPSGKMVVANDMRKLFPVIRDYSINHAIGILKTEMAYAEVGMAHCFVGNSSPGMYRMQGTDRFVIGPKGLSLRQNPKWAAKDKSRQVAGICTDLWWFSICDYDEFVKRNKSKPLNEHGYETVSCKPGVYQFKHVYRSCDHDAYDSPQIYTYIKRIRKPDKYKNYLEKYDNLNLTAGQIIAASIKKWPTLFGKPGPEGVMVAADHVMCTIGNGAEYHPNGFWTTGAELDNDSPSVEIPVFDGKHSWYPLSDYSVIAQIAGIASSIKLSRQSPIKKVNDSFISLAFNVCRCILLYGTEFGTGKDKGAWDKKTLSMARKCMKGLKKKYPDKIPEDCVELP